MNSIEGLTRITRFVVVAASLAAMAPAVTLAQKPGQRDTFFILGQGALTCGEATESWGKFGQISELDWLGYLQGYITGKNVERMRSGKDGWAGHDVSKDTLMALMKKACRDAPLKDFVVAADEIYAELAKLRSSR
jgi:hypothetical protein